MRVPEQRYLFTISFGCAPARVKELTSATFAALDSLKHFMPDSSTVEKVREMDLREREVNLKRNTFWLSALQFCLDNAIDPGQILTFPSLVATLTPRLVQDAARQYLNEKRYAMFDLYPATTTAEPAPAHSDH